VDGVNVGTKLVGTPSLSASLKIDIGRLQTASATNYYTGELRNVRVTAEALAGPSAAPSNRKWIYDSTLGKAASGATEEEQWDEICGEYFWSLYAPTYDWSALLVNGAVTGCVGPLCIDAEELPPKNPDGCSTAGDGCSFTEHVDRYAAQVVYAAQLRTRQIAHGERLHMYTTVNGVDFSDSRWDTVPIMQVFNLQAVAAGLAGFQAALKASGASGGSLTLLAQMETSVRAMAVKLNTMPNVGYVPNFNFEFYTTELSEYMKDFEDYVATMQDLAKAGLAMKARYQQLAIVATEQAGQKSVAQLTQKSTEQTISAAMTGMNAALKGLKHAGDLMNETAVALEDAIDRYEEEQRKARRRAMIFGCISLGLQVATGGLGLLETSMNIGSEKAKRKDATPWKGDDVWEWDGNLGNPRVKTKETGKYYDADGEEYTDMWKVAALPTPPRWLPTRRLPPALPGLPRVGAGDVPEERRFYGQRHSQLHGKRARRHLVQLGDQANQR